MSNFHELINRNTPTLVDFYANWCEPCKQVPAILQEIKDQFGSQVNIIKVDVENNRKAASKYDIQNIPTVILFKNGKAVWKKIGVPQVRDIQKAIKKIA